jgi:hypothetical protein
LRARAAPWPTQRASIWNAPTLARKENLHLEVVTALHQARAGLLLATDDAAGVSGALLTREPDLLVQAGLTPYGALPTETRNPALYFVT